MEADVPKLEPHILRLSILQYLHRRLFLVRQSIVHYPKPVEVFIDSSAPICVSSLSAFGGYTIPDSHDFVPTKV